MPMNAAVQSDWSVDLRHLGKRGSIAAFLLTRGRTSISGTGASLGGGLHIQSTWPLPELNCQVIGVELLVTHQLMQRFIRCAVMDSGGPSGSSGELSFLVFSSLRTALGIFFRY